MYVSLMKPKLWSVCVMLTRAGMLRHKLRKNEFILRSFFPRTFFQRIYHILSMVLEFLKDSREATPSAFTTLNTWLER